MLDDRKRGQLGSADKGCTKSNGQESRIDTTIAG